MIDKKNLEQLIDRTILLRNYCRNAEAIDEYNDNILDLQKQHKARFGSYYHSKENKGSHYVSLRSLCYGKS